MKMVGGVKHVVGFNAEGVYVWGEALWKEKKERVIPFPDVYLESKVEH